MERLFRLEMRQQPTFGDSTNSFSGKRCSRNDNRNSILMTCHNPDMGSAYD